MHWEGRQRVHLLKLQSASCWIKMHLAVFHGTGTAAFDGVGGYQLHFTVLVGDTGRMRVVARVTHARDLVDHQVDAAGAQDTTVLAGGVPVDLSALF
jgi:hypothetical protein